MRPFVMLVPNAVPAPVPDGTGTPPVPAPFTATPAGNAIQLTWVDDAPLFVDSNTPDRNAKIGYRIERCTDTGGGCADYAPIAKLTASCTMPPPQATLPPAWPCNYDPLNPWVNYNYTDSLVIPGTTYQYRIIAYNEFGDSSATSSFATVVGVTPASVVTLTPDQPSPHFVGTTVKFTATVTTPGPNPAYQYRFSLAVGAGAPSMMQDYSNTDNWSLPATTLPGSYTVTVDVRSNLASTAPDTSASVVNYQFVLPPITGASVVRNARTLTTYGTITQALADPALTTGDTLETMGTLFYSEPGNAVNITFPGALSLSGGWDPLYNTNPYMTNLQGSMTVTSGTVTVDKLIIQ